MVMCIASFGRLTLSVGILSYLVHLLFLVVFVGLGEKQILWLTLWPSLLLSITMLLLVLRLLSPSSVLEAWLRDSMLVSSV